jgi:hypothetical protein
MNIKTYSLLTVISLCTIPAHGMENNKNDFDKSVMGMFHNFARQQIQNTLHIQDMYKNAETPKKPKRKISTSDIDEANQLLYSDNVRELTSKEKKNLCEKLETKKQLLKEQYEVAETWSESDLDQRNHRDLLINYLNPKINNSIEKKY